jgi:hypothetical protein
MRDDGRDAWSPREHVRRQRRRALRFMLFGFLLAFVPALVVGFAAGYVGLEEFEFAAINTMVLWLTVGVSAPISTAGLIAFAMAPPVQDPEPRIEWWHWLAGVVYVVLVCLAVGFAFRETFRSDTAGAETVAPSETGPLASSPPADAPEPQQATVPGLDPDDPSSYAAGVAAIAGVDRADVQCEPGLLEHLEAAFCTAPADDGTLRLFSVVAGAPGSPTELSDPTPASGIEAELEADAGGPFRMVGCRLVPFGNGEEIEFNAVLQAAPGTWAECAGDTGSFLPKWQLIVASDGYLWWYGTH